MDKSGFTHTVISFPKTSTNCSDSLAASAQHLIFKFQLQFMMATATATMPLPFKDDENNSEHDVGMSLSPAPSPHTTLTPLEAAQLSAQARGGVNRIDDVESSSPPPDDGEGESRLPRLVADNDRFLSPTCSLSMSGVVSQNGMDDIETNLIQTTEEPSSSDEQLEKRILHLEQSLASLTELCKGLINQQQVRCHVTSGRCLIVFYRQHFIESPIRTHPVSKLVLLAA